MMATLQAEVRKLLTVRSTYIITTLALLLVSFICFYAFGIKSDGFGPAGLEQAIVAAVSSVSVFAGIVALLLICHEYRYNTLSYTLTISNSRLKVVLAKLLVSGVYGVVTALVTIILAIGLTTLGLAVDGRETGPQNLDIFSILWKSLVFMIGSIWAGLLFGLLFRNLALSVIVYFMVPTTVEPLLNGLLHVGNNYMPFASQNQVLMNPGGVAFSPLASAGVFTLYLVAGFVVATILFVRRDAN